MLATRLSGLEGRLKGTDALLKQSWEEVFPEIDIDLKALYRAWLGNLGSKK